jgi:hypothetical protein
MIAEGAGNDGGERFVRIGAGIALVLLSIVVAGLSLLPAQIARWVRGRNAG